MIVQDGSGRVVSACKVRIERMAKERGTRGVSFTGFQNAQGERMEQKSTIAQAFNLRSEGGEDYLFEALADLEDEGVVTVRAIPIRGVPQQNGLRKVRFVVTLSS